MLKDPAIRTAIAGCLGMAAAMGISRFVFTPILPAMMAGVPLSVSQAGWIASANYIGYLLGAYSAGGSWGRGREYNIGTASLVASLLLLLLMGLVESMPAMLVIRFLAGIGSAFTMVFLSTVVFARLMSLDRSDLQGSFFMGVGIGISASALVTGGIYLAGLDWHWGWIGSAILAALATLVTLALLQRPERAVARAAPEPALPRDRRLSAMIIAYGLFGAGYIVTATFLIAIVRANEGGPLVESGVWMATGLAVIPSVWLWHALSKRIGLTATFAVATLVEAFGVTASVMAGGTYGPYVGGVLLGGTFVGITSLGLLAGRHLAAASPRRATAVMTTAFGFGQVVAPVLAGYLAEWSGGFTLPSLVAAAVLVVAAAIAATIRMPPPPVASR